MTDFGPRFKYVEILEKHPQSSNLDYLDIQLKAPACELALAGQSNRVTNERWGNNVVAVAGYFNVFSLKSPANHVAVAGGSASINLTAPYNFVASASARTFVQASKESHSQRVAFAEDDCTADLQSSASVAVFAGRGAQVRLGPRGCAVLTHWDRVADRYRVVTLYEGEDGITANVWYTLNAAGQVVVCDNPREAYKPPNER